MVETFSAVCTILGFPHPSPFRLLFVYTVYSRPLRSIIFHPDQYSISSPFRLPSDLSKQLKDHPSIVFSFPPPLTTPLVLCHFLSLGTIDVSTPPGDLQRSIISYYCRPKPFGSRPRVAPIYFKRSSDQVSACEYGTYRWGSALTFALTPYPLPITPRCLAIGLSPRTNPPPIDPILFLLVI